MNAKDLRNNKFALLNRLQRQVDKANKQTQQQPSQDSLGFSLIENNVFAPVENIKPPTKLGLFLRRGNKGR